MAHLGSYSLQMHVRKEVKNSLNGRVFFLSSSSLKMVNCITAMAGKNNHNDGNAVHVGAAIRQLLNSYHIASKFDEANLVTSWERLVGKPIAKRTKKVFIKNKVLFVELDSP